MARQNKPNSEVTYSILITSFNRENFINECINSALKIKHDHFEIIIVDDHSNDNTWQLIEEVHAQNPHLRIYRNQTNLGQFANRNFIATLAKGKYLQFLDSDDTISPDALMNLERKMQSSGSELAYYSECVKEGVYRSNIVIRTHFFGLPTLSCGPTGMTISKQLFTKAGGFPTIYGVAGDVAFNINAAACSKSILLHSMSNFYYRRHPGQEINQSSDYALFNKLYSERFLETNNLVFNFFEKKAIKAAVNRRFLIDMFDKSIRAKMNLTRVEMFLFLSKTIWKSIGIPISLIPRTDTIDRPSELA